MMAMDLSEFYDTFFDEAEELLQSMESILLSLDPGNPDDEALNSIFRAAHSIKGGAATFGVFDQLVQTTHRLENVLDEARNHRLPVTRDAVDVFLRGKDILSDQVRAYRTGEIPDADQAGLFLSSLDALLSERAGHVEQGASVSAVDASSTSSDVVPDGAGDRHVLRVSFLGVSAKDLRTLESELGLLGEIVDQRGDAAEYAYMLLTDVDESVIRAICGFVIDDAQVTVQMCDIDPHVHASAAEAGQRDLSDLSNDRAQAELSSAMSNKNGSNSVAHASSDDGTVRQRQAPAKDTGTIRVATQRVDQLVNQVGEVVIEQAILTQACQRLDPIQHSALLQGIEHMAGALRTLQESVMALRMVPMEYAFGRYPRVVRETAAKLNKQIELHTSGAATELDKGLIEKLIDPLTHLIRNSLDHGIEAPEVRRAKGKNPTGRIDINAYHEGGRIMVEVTDDGAGMDRERILAKAVERGMPVSPAMTDNEVFQLVFTPGFSTAETVTDVSGRGVGMDVVRRNIQEIGGQIQIASTPDVGTTLRISLPLTLAIMDGMSIRTGKECFVLPLNHIVECLQPQAEQLHSLGATSHVLRLRGEHLPILRLAALFDIESACADLEQSILIVVQVGQERYALAVDQLLGQHQVVVKSLETHYERVVGISGATILGDGSVALIIDPATLVDLCQQATID